MSINTWSFSRLLNYEKCAHSVTFPYRASDSEATTRGRRIHDEMERAIKSEDLSGIPEKFRAQLPALPFSAMVEEAVYLSSTWTPAAKGSHWLVVKPDLVVRSPEKWTVIDYKTGKSAYNELKHGQQIQLYQLALACVYPEIPEFDSQLWYLDEDKIVPRGAIPRERLLKFQPRWDERARKMTLATKFPPNPTERNCKYCFERDRCGYAWEE